MKKFINISVAAVMILVGVSAFGATTNAIMFNDDFDTYAESTSLIGGTNGWWGSSTNIRAQSTVAVSGKAALIPTDATLSNRYSPASGSSNVWWTELYTKAVRYQGTAPTINSNAAAMFFINSNGYIVIHGGNGTNWNTITNSFSGTSNLVALSETAWHRINMVQNYTNQTWSLFVNNVLISQTNAFISNSLANFSGFDVYNGASATSYVDSVIVTGRPPSTLTSDADTDGLNDALELVYFGNVLNQTVSNDPDGDGYSNGSEFLAGTDPSDPASYPPSTTDTDGDTFTDYQENLMGTDQNNSNDYLHIVAGGIDLATPTSDSIVLPLIVGSGRVVTVYQSDGLDGAWSPAGEVTTELGQFSLSFTNDDAVAFSSQRFYRVASRRIGDSETATNEQSMAMYRQNRTAGTWTMIGVPVDYPQGSNNLNSLLGQDLASGLGAGPEGIADHIHILTGGGTWSSFFLNSSRTWQVVGGTNANMVITPGMGIYLERRAVAADRANAVFCGYKRTNTTYSITVNADWNILSWPFDRPNNESVGAGDVSSAGWRFLASGGVGHPSSDASRDLIWQQQASGTWKKFGLMSGINATYNGRWWNSSSGTFATNITMENGKAIFYLHRGAGMTWVVTNTP